MALRLQKGNRLPQKLRSVIQTVDVCAHFDVMSSVPLMRRQIKIRKTLGPARKRTFIEVVVAAGALRCLDVGPVSLRSERHAVLGHAESVSSRRAAGKIILVFDRANIGRLHISRSCWLRLQQRVHRIDRDSSSTESWPSRCCGSSASIATSPGCRRANVIGIGAREVA